MIYSLNEFFYEYPSYSRSDSKFSEFMNACVIAVESWIYTQGFFGTAYYSIPVDISIVTIEENKNKKKIVKIPFLELLLNLTGRAMEKLFRMT